LEVIVFTKFYPKMNIDKIQNIDLGILIGKNIKGLILDIDNTLVPQHRMDADENAIQWIEKVKNAGLKACIVSNASKKRVIRFNENLKIHAIHRAGKPGTRALKKALALMALKSNEAAMIGDQIFTDIYGGNKLGLFTILVDPIDKMEALWVRLKRYPEKIILRAYRKVPKV
jgi:uncharacterized protein